MKTTLRHLISAAALLATAATAQAAGSLVISPANKAVMPGDSFDLMVMGSGFTDAVVGGGFNLSFDASVLSLTAVKVDTVTWEFTSSSGTTNNAAGTLSDVYFNSFKAQLPTGDFTVATLTFAAKAGGSSMVHMSDSASFPFANDLAEVISVSYQDGSVTVSAVPEPASLAMLAAGLLALGLRRRQTT